MYLKRLVLIDTVSEMEIRRVDFVAGANFVVDSQSADMHNKVGKTTFLGLIDVVMGAKDRNKIYIDKEGTENSALKNLISNQEIAVELTIGDKGSIHTLHVGLFPRGPYRIDGARYSQENYRKKLNELLFNNLNNNPRFRELVPAFVRVELGQDNDKLLRHLNQFTSKAEYHAIYGFLFRVADPELAKSISFAKSEVTAIETAISKFKSVVNREDPAVVEQIIGALEKDRSEIETQLSDILDPSEFEKNRRLILQAREEYMQLMGEMGDLAYLTERLELSLREAERGSSTNVASSLAAQFFQEVKELLPDIQKDLEDMVQFNRALSENKKRYLRDNLETLQEELSQKERELFEFKANKEDLLALLQDGKAVERYSSLLRRLRHVESRLGEQEEVLNTFKELANDKERLQIEISSLSKAMESNAIDPTEVMGEFNGIFTPTARKINGDSPVLTYTTDPETFPVKFANLEGTSTGTRKSLAAAYDLSYQQFARQRGLKVPQFVVHDVVENIEGQDFRSIIRTADEFNTQFVVAVLKEKLDSSGIDKKYQEDHTILELSFEHRLFGD